MSTTAERLSFCDKASTILQRTSDGEQLTRSDLALLEAVLNGGVTEVGEQAFDALYESVVSGEYMRQPHWLHGIEHLTIDHAGYVYWRGRRVEHYSYRPRDEERVAAERLAARCRRLEEIGMPVTSRTVLLRSCYEAPAGSPWKIALQYYYTFLDGETLADSAAVFYRASGKPFTITAVGGVVEARDYAEVVEAYRDLQARGFRPVGGLQAYEEVALRLERLGLTPEQLSQAIGATPQSH